MKKNNRWLTLIGVIVGYITNRVERAAYKKNLQLLSDLNSDFTIPCNASGHYQIALDILYKRTKHSLVLFISGWNDSAFEKLRFVMQRGIVPKLFLMDAVVPNWIAENARDGKIIVYNGGIKGQLAEALYIDPEAPKNEFTSTLIISDEIATLKLSGFILTDAEITWSEICFRNTGAKQIYKNLIELEYSAQSNRY